MAKLFRYFQFDRAGMDAEKRTIPIAFSSELSISRGSYDEVLDHSREHIDLTRLQNAHPLLLNHDPEKQIGVVESAVVGNDKVGRAVVRFGTSQLAEEIFQDVRTGIRPHVSVGYERRDPISKSKEGGRDIVRFAWAPYEVSIVPIPADDTVGIGRSEDDYSKHFKEGKIMSDPVVPAPAPVAPAPAPTPGLELGRDNSNAEYQRQVEIDAIADRLENKVPNIRELAKSARKNRMSVADFRAQAMEALPQMQPIQPNKPLDVKPRDWEKYSLRAAIHKMAMGQFDGFEREMSQEVALRAGIQPNGFFMPQEAWAAGQRSLVAGTGTLGGMLVQITNLGDQFIELLRNRTKVMALGARLLTLDTPVTIPRQNAAGSTNWVGETVASTLNTGNFTQITLQPNAVTAFQQYSKQLLATNNPSIDMLVREDIIAQIALAVDLAALHGSGSGGQPTGIIATTGIGSVLLATNGQVMSNTTAYPALVSLESVVATANADAGALAYLMRPGLRGALKTSARFANSDTPVWDWRIPGTPLNGYRAEVSAQVASNLTTGTATTITSPIFFGNWTELLIAQFAGGATDIVVDPYSKAENGVVRILARKWIDVGVRHAASFCVLGGSLTT